MTKEQILAEISAKIAGQGNQIDIGGALAGILLALADAAKPIEVADITALTDKQLDALSVGDKVAKKTGTATHLYTVTYKDAENGGLCLTYEDASNVETVSYDHTASGWAYNSTDVTPLATAPETHVLQILNTGSGLTVDEALESLLLDGKKPTLESLKVITPLNTLMEHESFGQLAISCVYRPFENAVLITGGNYTSPDEMWEWFKIDIPESEECEIILNEEG